MSCSPIHAALIVALLLGTGMSPAAEAISADRILAALKANGPARHPRLIANAERFAEVKEMIRTQPRFRAWFDDYRAFGDGLLQEPLLKYQISTKHGSGNSLNQVARPLVQRLQAWCFLYRITGQANYADRARRELTNLGTFPDWCGGKTLDTGEIAGAYAIAYDWLFDVLTPEERAQMRRQLQDHAFTMVASSMNKKSGFAKAKGNVTDVVVGGVGLAALAVMEDVPEASQVLSDLLELLQQRIHGAYEPDGVGSEGPMYWSYALRYAIPLLASMDSSLGTDFGLSDSPGLRGAGAFALHATGPSGKSFGFSDSHSGPMRSTALLWLSTRYGVPAYGWQSLTDDSGDATAEVAEDDPELPEQVRDPFRFLWARPEKYQMPTAKTLPLNRMFKGEVELALLRSAWDSDAWFVGLKGGRNHLHHGDLDLGTFVLDADGVQWAVELGKNNYNAPGFFDFSGPRWDYYKKRAEGQNTLVINPGMGPDQQESTAPFTTFNGTPGHACAVLDMTGPYADAATSVRRGARLTEHQVLLQDDIETKAPAEIFWFMHTLATISIEDGGKTARLSQAGKTLYARCVSPPDAVFTVMPVAPLPGTPQPAKNDKIKQDVKKLSIHLRQVAKTSIAVSFASASEIPAPALIPLTSWGPVSSLHRLDVRTPQGMRELFQPESGPLPFVSAHRGGGRKGFPENCIATFEDTLRHAYAIIEIDPRYTKDGEIVVHHDSDLDRTTTGKGKVMDFTLAELKQLRLKDPEGKVTDYQIPTLDEALEWARGRTILVLDQKDVTAEARVKKITQHKAETCAIVIVSNFKDAKACHALNPDIMLEVMIPNLRKAEEFGTLGIPWNHVVAFVGHNPPEDKTLYEFIHRQGASCMIGTSRNLDLRVITREVTDIKALDPDYRAFLQHGADLIETDIPTLLGPLLQGATPASEPKQRFLSHG